MEYSAIAVVSSVLIVLSSVPESIDVLRYAHKFLRVSRINLVLPDYQRRGRVSFLS